MDVQGVDLTGVRLGDGVTDVTFTFTFMEYDAHALRERARMDDDHYDRARERAARMDKAHERAEVLLTEHLGARAREDYVRNKAFNVRGSNGHLYRISTHTNYNVTRDDGLCFCAVPKLIDSSVDPLPSPDRQLALKLWIESNADGYHLVAQYGGPAVDLAPPRTPPFRYPWLVRSAWSAAIARVSAAAQRAAVAMSRLLLRLPEPTRTTSVAAVAIAATVLIWGGGVTLVYLLCHLLL